MLRPYQTKKDRGGGGGGGGREGEIRPSHKAQRYSLTCQHQSAKPNTRPDSMGSRGIKSFLEISFCASRNIEHLLKRK